jgi:hypothetical protein
MPDELQTRGLPARACKPNPLLTPIVPVGMVWDYSSSLHKFHISTPNIAF